MQRNGNPRVSVVVPTRNEARNLEVVLPAIAAVRPAVHEIIVVDGHSVDGSVDTAQRVLPWVRAITQTRKGKPRRTRVRVGRTKQWKKAIVTLHSEHRIDFF